MNVDGKPYRTIWPSTDAASFEVIDQTKLPHAFTTARITTSKAAGEAIRTMVVRGAPLIGATAAYGLGLAMREDPSDAGLDGASAALLATRPTAVNLRWALDRVRAVVAPLAPAERAEAAWRTAAEICEEDVETNRAIGRHGLDVVRGLAEAKSGARSGGDSGGGSGGERVNILTHCNAGWLATVDWGTALAPVYTAHDAGIPVHVWVDETRPRNQGAGLTAWELAQHGVPHTVIVDSAGGHVMQRGMVDCCITGTDRTTATGDVCNKIGTYQKALAARDNDIPFYVGLPGPTIDWSIDDGRDIAIEERDASEVERVTGQTDDGAIATVRVTPEGTRAANYAFDVTPARLVTGLITERGLCSASAEGLGALYPDRAKTVAP